MEHPDLKSYEVIGIREDRIMNMSLNLSREGAEKELEEFLESKEYTHVVFRETFFYDKCHIEKKDNE